MVFKTKNSTHLKLSNLLVLLSLNRVTVDSFIEVLFYPLVGFDNIWRNNISAKLSENPKID
jgi:hypothetical protein